MYTIAISSIRQWYVIMDECMLSIKVIPKSSKNSIECADGVYRVHVNAPPVDEKANKSLIAFLAKVLDVPKSSVTIAHGQKARNKNVKITGLDAEAVKLRIENFARRKAQRKYNE